MASPRNRTLDRRLAAVTVATRNAVRQREVVREHAKAARTIRLAALRGGVDLREVHGIERLAYTEADLAQRGVTPETRGADADFIAHDPELSLRANWEARVADRIANFRQTRPRGSYVSLDDWYAWALAQQEPLPPTGRFRGKHAGPPKPGRGNRWKKRTPRKILRWAVDRMRDRDR